MDLPNWIIEQLPSIDLSRPINEDALIASIIQWSAVDTESDQVRSFLKMIEETLQRSIWEIIEL